MKNYINDVGLSVCAVVQISQQYFLTGHKEYNQWYGYYDMNTGLWKKVKMVMRNG